MAVSIYESISIRNRWSHLGTVYLYKYKFMLSLLPTSIDHRSQAYHHFWTNRPICCQGLVIASILTRGNLRWFQLRRSHVHSHRHRFAVAARREQNEPTCQISYTQFIIISRKSALSLSIVLDQVVFHQSRSVRRLWLIMILSRGRWIHQWRLCVPQPRAVFVIWSPLISTSSDQTYYGRHNTLHQLNWLISLQNRSILSLPPSWTARFYSDPHLALPLWSSLAVLCCCLHLTWYIKI